MGAHIFQLNISQGGVPKLPIHEAEVTPTGLVGDHQTHRQFHGGPQRALCLYALECLLHLQQEGHPIFPGSIGENITTSGLEWSSLQPGNKLRLGENVLIEITSYAAPCKTISRSFQNGKYGCVDQEKHSGMSRLYAKVLRTGTLRIGQPIERVLC
jgi:MOSC domain-containing protein YiiM